MILSLSKDQVLLSQAREQLSRLVEDVASGVKPGVSIIKDGKSQAVLISTEQYEQLTADKEAIFNAIDNLLNLKEALEDFKEKQTVTEQAFFAKLGKRYDSGK